MGSSQHRQHRSGGAPLAEYGDRQFPRPPLADDLAALAEGASHEFPRPQATDDLEVLALHLEGLRGLIDARLGRAARWRGQMRRELHGYAQPSEVMRYARAFDQLLPAALAPSWTLDAGILGEIHDSAVGGGAFRTTELTVGGHHKFPPPSAVPELVDNVLAQTAASSEPPAVMATRLHLNLLTIHPFLDGNGRTARLAATLWLARGGFRSTLFTAVEQHFHPTPAEYIGILDRFRYGEIDEDRCIACLLRAMIANAMYAAWFRARELRLRAHCDALGIPAKVTAQALEAYELKPNPTGNAAALAAALASEDNPLHRLKETLTPGERTELAFQVTRMLDEEAEARSPPGRRKSPIESERQTGGANEATLVRREAPADRHQ